jgi:hypothetical protein
MNLTLTAQEKLSISIAKADIELREIEARKRALKRYRNDQARRRENRILLLICLSAAIFSTILFSVIESAIAEEAGAKQGPILAKSEMTKAQVKALNVIPSVSEKHGAKK